MAGGMLVLSRMEGEKIIVTLPSGEECTIELVEVRGRRAKIGFIFPLSVAIFREEINNNREKPVT